MSALVACPRCVNGKLYNGPHPYMCTNCGGSGTYPLPVKYAGIGSRETPRAVALVMENVAMQLAMRGFMLRSGAGKRPVQPKPDTDSADLAFERGCDMMAGRKVIRTATLSERALDHAAQYHPNWSACNENARTLHARNSLIMCGDWLDDPVSFVVCWTEGGQVKGGTGQALRIAAALPVPVPVFNLAVTPVDALWSWLNGK